MARGGHLTLSLTAILKRGKNKNQTLFGGNREQDLEDLKQRISQAADAAKSLKARCTRSTP